MLTPIQAFHHPAIVHRCHCAAERPLRPIIRDLIHPGLVPLATIGLLQVTRRSIDHQTHIESGSIARLPLLPPPFFPHYSTPRHVFQTIDLPELPVTITLEQLVNTIDTPTKCPKSLRIGFLCCSSSASTILTIALNGTSLGDAPGFVG